MITLNSSAFIGTNH